MNGIAHRILQKDDVPCISPDLDIWQARELFLLSLESPATKRAYDRHTREFCFLLGLSSLGQVEAGHLVAYANILSGEAQGIATRTQALNSVRSFLAWAASLDGVHLRPEQIKAILKIPKGCVLTPYEVLTQAEIGRFLGAARASGPRDYALMLVFLGGGLRVSEVVALAGKDLREDGDGEPFLHIRGGKGQKDRFVPILREVSGAVEAYLLAGKRSLGTDATVFLRDSTRAAGEPMDARACGDLVHQFCREAQISKRISPHSLRHTYAIACLRHRRNLMAVSKLLGHSLLTTTQRYVNHLDLLEMREVVPGFLVGAQSD